MFTEITEDTISATDSCQMEPDNFQQFCISNGFLLQDPLLR